MTEEVAFSLGTSAGDTQRAAFLQPQTRLLASTITHRSLGKDVAVVGRGVLQPGTAPCGLQFLPPWNSRSAGAQRPFRALGCFSEGWEVPAWGQRS